MSERMLEAAVKVEGAWISGCNGVHPYVLGAWRCNGGTVAGHKATVKNKASGYDSTICKVHFADPQNQPEIKSVLCAFVNFVVLQSIICNFDKIYLFAKYSLLSLQIS